MGDSRRRNASWTTGKLRLSELVEMKRRGEKFGMVTSYDAPSGRLADAAGVDMILVGDSSGMVVHGRESTVAVKNASQLRSANACPTGERPAFMMIGRVSP